MSTPKNVTIICGFLGSGKTTFLNNFLKKFPSENFAIIENEFGETNIDKKIIDNGEATGVYELNNGCICCSIQSQFGTVINSLLMSNTRFNHLLIETTGIADPSSIIETFTSGERMMQKFKIKNIICIVDAENIEDQIKDHYESVKQIALADTIILNKSDLVSKEYIPTLTKQIQTINPFAEIFETSFSNIDHLLLQDISDESATNINKRIRLYNKIPSAMKHQFSTVCIELSGVFNTEKLQVWIEYFLLFNSDSIFRVKGVVATSNDENINLLQAVNQRFTISSLTDKRDSEFVNQIVFIGKKLDATELKQSLSSLLV